MFLLSLVYHYHQMKDLKEHLKWKRKDKQIHWCINHKRKCSLFTCLYPFPLPLPLTHPLLLTAIIFHLPFQFHSPSSFFSPSISSLWFLPLPLPLSPYLYLTFSLPPTSHFCSSSFTPSLSFSFLFFFLLLFLIFLFPPQSELAPFSSTSSLSFSFLFFFVLPRQTFSLPPPPSPSSFPSISSLSFLLRVLSLVLPLPPSLVLPSLSQSDHELSTSEEGKKPWCMISCAELTLPDPSHNCLWLSTIPSDLLWPFLIFILSYFHYRFLFFIISFRFVIFCFSLSHYSLLSIILLSSWLSS